MATFSAESIVRYDLAGYESAVEDSVIFSNFRDRFGEVAAFSAHETLTQDPFHFDLLDAMGRPTKLQFELTDYQRSVASPEKVTGLVYVGEEDEEHETLRKLLKLNGDLELYGHQELVAHLEPIPLRRAIGNSAIGRITLIGDTSREDCNFKNISPEATRQFNTYQASTIADSGRITVARFAEIIKG